jgi:formylglycine-generating enzyme required for sulfatase activity
LWNIGGAAASGTGWQSGLPAAALRGGAWGEGARAGVFALDLIDTPSHWTSSIGFRCVAR